MPPQDDPRLAVGPRAHRVDADLASACLGHVQGGLARRDTSGRHQEVDVLAGGQPEQWADLNNRFHATIARLTGMPMLQEMMERALDRWDRVRRYYFSGVLVHRAEQAQQEHHALLAAIKSRDLPTLESLVRQHNQGALSSYTAYVQAVPAPPTI